MPVEVTVPPSTPTLKAFAADWDALSPIGRNQFRASLLEGGWFEACRRAVADCKVYEIDRWLNNEGSRADIVAAISRSDTSVDVGQFFVRQMRAYLYCAKAALAKQSSDVDRYIREATSETGYPTSFYLDLIALFKGTLLPIAPKNTVRIGVLLVGGDGHGVVARLILERIERGTGALYPGPSLGFTYRDAEFLQAEQAARLISRANGHAWRDDSDIRWSIDGIPDGMRKFKDKSLGAAFAVGIHCLFTCPHDLGHIAVSGALTVGGNLESVSSIEAKLSAAHMPANAITAVITPVAEVEAMRRYSSSLEIINVQTLRDAIRVVRIVKRKDMLGRRRTVLVRTLALIGLVASVVLVSEGCMHSYSFRGGERVIVTLGSTYPFAPHTDIDTGFILRDFSADAISNLQMEGAIWGMSPGNAWGHEVASALPPSFNRAQLLHRLDRKSDSESTLRSLLQSDSSVEEGNAAMLLAEISPRERVLAMQASSQWFDYYCKIGSGGAVETGQALAHIDPKSSQRVAAGLHSLIKSEGNNSVNIAALRILVRANPGDHHFALAFLNRLLADRDESIRVKAAGLLFELDPRQANQCLSIIVPSLLSHDGTVSRAAFDAISSVGAMYPDKIEAELQRIDSSKPGGLWPTVAEISRTSVTAKSARAILDVLMADDTDDFRQAVLNVDDFFLLDRTNVETYTRFLGMRLASLAIRNHGHLTSVDYLLNEMRSPVANQWAMYRNGCALAIGIVSRGKNRHEIADYIHTLWKRDTLCNMKIAHAIAYEQLMKDYDAYGYRN